MAKFNIIGLVYPGLVNVKLNNGFRDVELFNASDEVLEQLFNDKCPYVMLSPEEFLLRNPEVSEIKIEPLDLKRTKKPTSYSS